MSNEQLLQRLNGRVVEVDGQAWQIDVYSIVDSESNRWVQVGLNGEDSRTALLKLACLADDEDAIVAIEDWIRNSSVLVSGIVSVADRE
jgi:hypothetical protein